MYFFISPLTKYFRRNNAEGQKAADIKSKFIEESIHFYELNEKKHNDGGQINYQI